MRGATANWESYSLLPVGSHVDDRVSSARRDAVVDEDLPSSTIPRLADLVGNHVSGWTSARDKHTSSKGSHTEPNTATSRGE